MSHKERPGTIRLTLPGTSANLGPGFDAVGLALSLTLVVEARVAPRYAIDATGRDAEVCGNAENSLVLQVYRDVLRAAGVEALPLALQVKNEIPLGMGCGSSAAARLAGVAFASHFGRLRWTDEEIIAEASTREGHPDNVAACWYGGLTVSVPHRGSVLHATFAGEGAWQMILALPKGSVATEKARGALPEGYTREDTVFNVQRTALLIAAFAQQRLDLLHVAMEDRLHHPYRRAMCPLLEHVGALNQAEEFAGAALSGAGPALLIILHSHTTLPAAEARLRKVLGKDVELLPVRIGGPAALDLLGEG